MRICKEEDCNNQAFGQGYCNMHYKRLRKRGLLPVKVKPKAGLCCEIEGCDKPRKGDGLCAKHWSRRKRHGDAIAEGIEERGYVADWITNTALKWDNDDCLEWPFYKDRKNGYGQLSVENKRVVASRYICAQAHGEPPNDGYYEAAHSCGNGHLSCVNPKHLRWATPKENSADKAKHGTLVRGSQSKSAKLAEADVIEILRQLAQGVQQKEIANRFGVVQSVITDLKYGRAWKHVSRGLTENEN